MKSRGLHLAIAWKRMFADGMVEDGILRIEPGECPEKEGAMRHRNKHPKDRFLKRSPGTSVDMIVPPTGRILIEWISTNELLPRFEILIFRVWKGSIKPIE